MQKQQNNENIPLLQLGHNPLQVSFFDIANILLGSYTRDLQSAFPAEIQHFRISLEIPNRELTLIITLYAP